MKMMVSFELIDQVLFADDIATDQFAVQLLMLTLKHILWIYHKQPIID